MVTKYKPVGSTPCDNTTTFCGNCPFGSNAEPVPYYSGSDTETRKRGNVDSNSVCGSDGQVLPYIEPPQYKYRVTSDAGGRSCKKCTGDPGETDCIYNIDCTNCNYGYVQNFNQTACVYKCTKDGGDARNNDSDSNSANNYYIYGENGIGGLCYRRKLMLTGAWEEDSHFKNSDYQGGAVMNTGDSKNPPEEEGYGIAFCDNSCNERTGTWDSLPGSSYEGAGSKQATVQKYTFGGHCYHTGNGHCYAPFTNDMYVHKQPSSEGPEYMHMREKGGSWDIGKPTQCWTKDVLAQDTVLNLADYTYFPAPDTNSEYHCTGE
jgi:hypothetical protein